MVRFAMFAVVVLTGALAFGQTAKEMRTITRAQREWQLRQEATGEATTPSPPAIEYRGKERTWTDTADKTMTGTADSVEITVVLKVSGGKKVKLPFSKLSQQDQQWVRRWIASDIDKQK